MKSQHEYPSRTYVSEKDKIKYNHIPSVKYIDRIMPFADEIKKNPNVDSCTVAILTNSSESIWLSCIPAMSIKHFIFGNYRAHILFNTKKIKNNVLIFAKNLEAKDNLEKKIKKLHEKYNLHQVYYISRKCSDCTVVATCNATKSINDPISFHKNTIDGVESWIIDFLDHTIDIY